MQLLETMDGGVEDWNSFYSIYWKVARQKVAGGWIIYRDQKLCSIATGKIKSMTSTAVFVADPKHECTDAFFVE